jgi:hypothetical protein
MMIEGGRMRGISLAEVQVRARKFLKREFDYVAYFANIHHNRDAPDSIPPPDTMRHYRSKGIYQNHKVFIRLY